MKNSKGSINLNNIKLEDIKVQFCNEKIKKGDTSSNSLLSCEVEIPFELINHILGYLDKKSIIITSEVSRSWYSFLLDAPIWEEMTKREFKTKMKVSNWTWRQTFFEMQADKWRRQKRGIIANAQKAKWRCRVRCGMRRPPPNIITRSSYLPKNFIPNDAWKVHPNATQDPVIEWNFDIQQSAKNLLFMYRMATDSSLFRKKSHLTRAIVRYERFLKLKHKHKDKFLIPTLDIEVVWHSHLIRPSIYLKDMETLFGAGVVINHKLVASDVEIVFFKEALKETQKLWDDEYGSGDYGVINEHCLPKRAPYFINKRISSSVVLKDSSVMFYTPPDSSEKKEEEKKKKIKRKRESTPQVVSLTTKQIEQDSLEWFKGFQEYMGYTVTQHYINETGKKSYERFMYFCWKTIKEELMIHPTFAIDLFWHAHMCHPIEYINDCNRLVGELVDHDPNPKFLAENFENGDTKWSEEFGIPIESEHTMVPCKGKKMRSSVYAKRWDWLS